MTGHRGDAKADEFLKSINGFVLHKPFQLKDLLDLVAIAEVRRTFRSVFDFKPDEADSPRAEPSLTDQNLSRRESAVGVAAFAPVADPVSSAPQREAPRGRAAWAMAGIVAAGIALLMIVGWSFDARYRSAQQRAGAAIAERQALEAVWRGLAPQLEEATDARGGFASLPKRAKRLAEEQAVRGWTSALRTVAVNFGSEIKLRGIASRGVEGLPGACEVLLDGVATGPSPHELVNEYYRVLDREAERMFPGKVALELEKIEPDTEVSADSDRRQAAFTLTMKMGSNQPADRGTAAAK